MLYGYCKVFPDSILEKEYYSMERQKARLTSAGVQEKDIVCETEDSECVGAEFKNLLQKAYTGDTIAVVEFERIVCSLDLGQAIADEMMKRHINLLVTHPQGEDFLTIDTLKREKQMSSQADFMLGFACAQYADAKRKRLEDFWKEGRK